MDYVKPDRASALAAAYVLGTLRGPARRRFEALLPAHPGLRAAVAAWETRLLPYAQAVRPVQPSAAVWRGIEERLFGDPAAIALKAPIAASDRARPPSPVARWWQSLALWQTLAATALVAAVGLGMLAAREPQPGPPVVVVLGVNPEAAQALRASFVASVGPDGRSLVLKPLEPLSLAAGRALELWAVPAQGAPRSLGLVRPDGQTTVLRTRLLQDTAAFAVSLEPSGGSPSGAPTGPIVSVGKLEI